jgi:hypothetical protein
LQAAHHFFADLGELLIAEPAIYRHNAETGAVALLGMGSAFQDLLAQGLDSGAKRNVLKRSGFECPFQARQSRLGMAS